MSIEAVVDEDRHILRALNGFQEQFVLSEDRNTDQPLSSPVNSDTSSSVNIEGRPCSPVNSDTSSNTNAEGRLCSPVSSDTSSNANAEENVSSRPICKINREDSTLRRRNIRRCVSDSKEICVPTRSMLTMKGNVVSHLVDKHDEMYDEMSSLQIRINENEKVIDKLEETEYRQREEISNTLVNLEERDSKIKYLEEQITDLEADLNNLRKGSMWGISSFIHANTVIYIQFLINVSFYAYIKFFV